MGLNALFEHHLTEDNLAHLRSHEYRYVAPGHSLAIKNVNYIVALYRYCANSLVFRIYTHMNLCNYVYRIYIYTMELRHPNQGLHLDRDIYNIYMYIYLYVYL